MASGCEERAERLFVLFYLERIVDVSKCQAKLSGVATFVLPTRDCIRRGIQIEYDLADENYYTIGSAISSMNQMCSNFHCHFVRIVFKLSTHCDEIIGVE